MIRNQQNSGVHQLLDREPPADYRQEWTDRIALEGIEVEAGAKSVVIFRIEAEWLALPTIVIQEVADLHVIHTIPHRPNGPLLGLACVRGELLLCASLGAVLGLEKTASEKDKKLSTTHRRLLIVNREVNRVALPADEVFGVHRYHLRELKEVPDTLPKVAVAHTIGLLPWRNKMVGCLDDELLFYTLDKSFS